jgi:hypothetical protein
MKSALTDGLDKYKSDIISSEQQVPKSRDNESGEWEKI